MNKSKLMKKAWEIAIKAAEKFNDSIKKFFSESLKEAWKTLKNENLISGLCEIGNEWKKGNHHRIYFNYLTKYVNVDELSWKLEKAVMHATAYYSVTEKCWYRDEKIADIFSEKIKPAIEKEALKAISISVLSSNMINEKAIEIEVEKIAAEIAICY